MTGRLVPHDDVAAWTSAIAACIANAPRAGRTAVRRMQEVAADTFGMYRELVARPLAAACTRVTMSPGRTAPTVVVTADPEIPVPPAQYGGIERIVHLLVEGLMRHGHEVVLIGHRDSRVSCELVPYPGRSQAPLDIVRNAGAVAATVRRHHADIVHSFGRLAYLAALARHPVHKIMLYQRAVTPRSIRAAVTLFGRLIEFTACSRQQMAAVEALACWHVVYNGVPVDRFTFQPEVPADAPLVFLGRVEEIKGAHLAVEVARRSRRPLVIAGNVEPEHRRYFRERIQPALDGRAVRYLGPVDDAQKNVLLGGAAALLMPIQWDEPFGIVMAESLACGTPVVGLRRGSVPEVVTDGETGVVADDLEGMIAGVSRLTAVDRRACRAAAETRFSDRVVVESYRRIYADAVCGSRQSTDPKGALA